MIRLGLGDGLERLSRLGAHGHLGHVPIAVRHGDLGERLLGGQLLDGREVDRLEFNALQVGETELGETTLERHLTAFEAQLTRVTRTRLRTLVTTRGRATVTRTGTATDTFVVVR